MGLPKDILEAMLKDIAKAESALAELDDVVRDMRLAGLDTAKYDKEVDDLGDEIRKHRIVYERQKAKLG